METRNWKWFELGILFSEIYRAEAHVKADLEIGKFEEENEVPFISRTDNNNGCDCYVKKTDTMVIEKGNAITIGDTTATCFYQQNAFTTGDHMVVCRADWMNKYNALFVVSIINKERYRFNYGRAFKMDIIRAFKIKLPINEQGNPDWQWIETFVKEKLIPELPPKAKSVWLKNFDEKPLSNNLLQLKTENWKWFRYEEVFDIKHGFYNKKPDENINGNIPFIGATDSNNGITSMHDISTIEASSKTGEEPNASLNEKLFSPNCITVSNNGSIGFAFFQSQKFTCTHDVNPLYLKNHELNKHIAMFLCTLIEMEKYRWAYGRKWRPVRMPSSKIKLPATPAGTPGWQFMEDYIKRLPYSRCL